MSTSVPQTEQVLDRRTRRGRTEGPSQKLKNFGGMVRPCWRQPSYPREVDCKPNVKRSSTRRCDVNAFSTEGFVASLTTYCSRDVLPSSNAHHDRSFTRPIVFLNSSPSIHWSARHKHFVRLRLCSLNTVLHEPLHTTVGARVDVSGRVSALCDVSGLRGLRRWLCCPWRVWYGLRMSVRSVV